MKFLTQGAESKVYSTEWLGQNVIVKKRFSKAYRHRDLDIQITRDRMKAESKALVRCHALGLRVPILYDVNLNSNEIIMENLEKCIQVRNYISNLSRDDLRLMKDQSIVNLSEDIGKYLSNLHLNHLIHGDLTTSNILVNGDTKDIALIDFGLAYTSEQDEDKAVDLYVLERAILSTHPDSERFVEVLFDAYLAVNKKQQIKVIKKLDEVRARGRKKLCFG